MEPWLAEEVFDEKLHCYVLGSATCIHFAGNIDTRYLSENAGNTQVKYVVNPATSGLKCSFVELVAPEGVDAQTPQWCRCSSLSD